MLQNHPNFTKYRNMTCLKSRGSPDYSLLTRSLQGLTLDLFTPNMTRKPNLSTNRGSDCPDQISSLIVAKDDSGKYCPKPPVVRAGPVAHRPCLTD